MIIQSQSNQWIKLARAIINGQKESKNYFLAEGEKLINTLLTIYKPIILLTNQKNTQENCLMVSDDLWKTISEVKSPTKLIGIFERPKYSLNEDLEEANDLIILDEIQDAGNLGTILRTAMASNWKNIICLKGTVNPFSSKVIRSSAGALGGLKIFTDIEIDTLIDILKNKFTIIYTTSHSEYNFKNIDFTQIKKPCLILGNEGRGIKESIKKNIISNNLDLIEANIPIINSQIVESLNVGIAGALLMYKIKNLI